MKKKILFASLGLSLVLALTACSGGKNKEESAKNNATAKAQVENKKENSGIKVSENGKTESVDPSEAKVFADTRDMKDVLVTKVSKEEAFDKFKNAHKNVKIESLGLDLEGNNLFYKIDGYDAEKEYEMTINAETGEIVKDEFEAEKNQGKVADIQREMLSAIEGYIEKALADADQGYLAKEYALEYDDGKYIVEVEVEKDGKDISYKYDLKLGDLIKKDM